MGATTFSNLETGKNAEDAFSQAVSQAAYEDGHAGYTGTIAEKGFFGYLTRTPVSEAEAYVLANRDLESRNSKFSDKWGPAGCIPVVRGLREITVTGLSGLRNEADKAIRQAVTDRCLLKKGERVESTRLTGYSTPRAHGYGYRPAPATFSDGTAVVTIRTASAPTQRTVTVTVTIRGSHSREQAEAEVTEALAASRNRLKERETVTGIALETTEHPAERTYKTQAAASKGKTVTRYVVKGTRHDTWERGLEAQAQARAVAVAAADAAPNAFWGEREATYEVTAITRREDGSPLVSVTRSLVKTVYTAQVTITHTPPTATQPDAWLFYGWASW